MSGQPPDNEGKEMQYWEETAAMFSQLFKKPPMAEKYLTKPPFKYLFDIVMSTAKETGFPNNLYSAEELNPEIYKDKDSKMKFLNKLIDLVNLCIGDKLEVKANKIVAGLEPENTNTLLQAFYQIAVSGKSFDEYINEIASQYSGAGSEPSDKSKKKDKEESKNEEDKKHAKDDKHKGAEDKKEKPKKEEETKGAEDKRIEKQKSPEAKEPKKEGKPKAEKKTEQREHPNKEEEEPSKKQKNETKQKQSQKGEKEKKQIDKGVEIEKVKRKDKDKGDETKAKEGERPMTPPKGSKGKGEKKEEKANQKPEKANEPETMPNPKKPTKVEDIDPAKHGGLVRGAMEDIKKVTESEESNTQAQMEDPGSSKIHMGHIKKKAAKTDNTKAPEAPIKKSNVEGGEAEFLKQAIQSLTQLTMPLGKSIDFINEDLDTMSKEYENWRKQALEGYAKMEDLQKESELSLQPLQDKLAEIEEQIKDQLTKIVNIKTQIFKNEINIQSMISTLVGKG